MAQTVTLQLPDKTLERYQRGAAAARKVLEEFIAERLEEAAPPSIEGLPFPLSEEMKTMEELDDAALWRMARSQLPPDRQRLYSRLLTEKSQGTLTPQAEKTLNSLGEEARRLTLKKAHAYMLLKWRGHNIPSREALQSSE
ncbi:MAG: hypothetical protein ACE5F6_15125 [Anaerolineae bacterium]